MNPGEYDLMFRVEDSHWWYRNLHALVERALAHHVPDRRARVLDAGCGTGAMASRLSAAYRVVGLDYSPDALHFAASRGTGSFVRGSVESLPFARDTFAAAIALDVIIHKAVGSPEKALEEMARVIVPGGHLILNVPAYPWLYSPHDRQVQNARRYDRKPLLGLIRASGLDVVGCTHWNALLMPAVIAARLGKRMIGRTTSDLSEFRPGAGARICGAAMAVERAFLRAAPLPFGVSLFVVARKPAV